MSSPNFIDKVLTGVPVVDKGQQIMDKMMLNQYQNSPNLREYYMAYIAEMDYLFETIETVYLGRFIEYAQGRQLDIIGIILQQSRAVELSSFFFGFDGAFGATKMADESTPNDGGIFKSEDNAGFEVTPLDDATYKRLLIAKTHSMNSDTADINLAYKVISTLLGRVPAHFEINTIATKHVDLELATSEVTNTEITLIDYATKYFVPSGVTFTISQV